MVDLRPIYFHEARRRLIGNRLAVYDELYVAGPCTGTELATRLGWPITSVRPRLTELREINAAIETGTRRNGEHEFRALTADEMKHILADRQREEDAAAMPETVAVVHDGAHAQQQELFA